MLARHVADRLADRVAAGALGEGARGRHRASRSRCTSRTSPGPATNGRCDAPARAVTVAGPRRPAGSTSCCRAASTTRRAPSGGNSYDRRVVEALGRLGVAGPAARRAGWLALPGRPDDVRRLGAVLAGLPDGGTVLARRAGRRAAAPGGPRPRDAAGCGSVVLVHLPLADETGLAPAEAAGARRARAARPARRGRRRRHQPRDGGPGASPARPGRRCRRGRRARAWTAARPRDRSGHGGRFALRRLGDPAQGPRRARSRPSRGSDRPARGPARASVRCRRRRLRGRAAGHGRAARLAAAGPPGRPARRRRPRRRLRRGATCSCCPRAPSPTGWSSPRPWPAACRCVASDGRRRPRGARDGHRTARGPACSCRPATRPPWPRALRRWLDRPGPAAALRGRGARPAAPRSPAGTTPPAPSPRRSTTGGPHEQQPPRARRGRPVDLLPRLARPARAGRRRPPAATELADSSVRRSGRDAGGRRPAGSPVVVHDLGCGSGSMGRWLAPRLPGPQHWVLHDRDPALLALAAPRAGTAPGGAPVTVEPRRGDVSALTAPTWPGPTWSPPRRCSTCSPPPRSEAVVAARGGGRLPRRSSRCRCWAGSSWTPPDPAGRRRRGGLQRSPAPPGRRPAAARPGRRSRSPRRRSPGTGTTSRSGPARGGSAVRTAPGCSPPGSTAGSARRPSRAPASCPRGTAPGAPRQPRGRPCGVTVHHADLLARPPAERRRPPARVVG